MEVRGEVDLSTASAVVEAVATGLADRSDGADGRRVVLDLAQVTFLDSTGIAALIECQAACEAQGARMSIGPRSSTVDTVFGYTGVDATFVLD